MLLTESAVPSSHRICGSFRDPSGYVFERRGEILRAIDDECYEILRRLFDDGTFGHLVDRRLLLTTEFIEDGALRAQLETEHDGFRHFLRHHRVRTVTYPYEWSISMLADAAVTTLDLQMELLSSGLSLKNASAYNIQFVRGRPRFIDLGSIERPKRLDVWFALGQFSQMFLFPLLLCRYRGWDLRSYFVGSLGGRGIEEVARSFGRLGRMRPGLLWDLTLPLLLHRWAEKGQRARRDVLERDSKSIQPQLLNLRRLRAKIVKLAAGYKPAGVWSDYTETCNYDDTAETAKRALVADFLRTACPKRVLDLGSNTGDYSRLAVQCGASDVLAIDSDHDAVELLYRQLRDQQAPITPMVVDLCNPSPAIGYMNRERTSLFERVHPDCTLALALVHHLLVSGNLSLEAIRDMLWETTERYLILEFVPTDDDMFRRLMRFRVDLFGDLSLQLCRDAFSQRFRVLKEEPIPNSKRTLLFLEKTLQ